MSALADALNRMTAELMQIASAQEGLERERDFYKRKWITAQREAMTPEELAWLAEFERRVAGD